MRILVQSAHHHSPDGFESISLVNNTNIPATDTFTRILQPFHSQINHPETVSLSPARIQYVLFPEEAHARLLSTYIRRIINKIN